MSWPRAGNGLAQVDELLRTRVRLVYRDPRGRTRFRLIAAHRLARYQASWPLMFPEPDNLMGRGIVSPAPTRTFPPPPAKPAGRDARKGAK